MKTGLERLLNEKQLQDKIEGNIAILCHSPSVTENYEIAPSALKRIFGKRLVKIFGPQHGFVTDVQDNMVETRDFVHPYFKMPVHSLYSHDRKPSPEMLKNIDTVLIDLQDVGTRIYTYIYTMTYMMEACAEQGIKVVILDRPNPINGIDVEGNVLDMNFKSFVGRHPLPVRHGLTLAEVALWAEKFCGIKSHLEIIPMTGWERSMSYEDTKLPWVLPSPNLPVIDGCYTFPGTVLFEGTNISEGRGTTRALEIVGHPKIEPYSMAPELMAKAQKEGLQGFILRPTNFLPTFQKHAGISCGGFQIHVTDRKVFRPWALGQFLCREFYHRLGSDFAWKKPPYEYEENLLPIDIINGTDQIRKWVEANGSIEELNALEQNRDFENFLSQRKEISK